MFMRIGTIPIVSTYEILHKTYCYVGGFAVTIRFIYNHDHRLNRWFEQPL